MNARIILLIAIFLMLGLAWFFCRGGKNPLHVDPHAAEEIEKAKRR